jgi:hypothetical protein
MQIFKITIHGMNFFFSTKKDAEKCLDELVGTNLVGNSQPIIEEDFYKSSSLIEKSIYHYNNGWICECYAFKRKKKTFKSLIGQTITKVIITEDKTEVLFCTENNKFIMWHYQDSSEDVHLESIHGGDLKNLEGTTILSISKDCTKGNIASGESQTITFYRIANKDITFTLKWVSIYTDNSDKYNYFTSSKLAINLSELSENFIITTSNVFKMEYRIRSYFSDNNLNGSRILPGVA